MGLACLGLPIKSTEAEGDPSSTDPESRLSVEPQRWGLSVASPHCIVPEASCCVDVLCDHHILSTLIIIPNLSPTSTQTSHSSKFKHPDALNKTETTTQAIKLQQSNNYHVLTTSIRGIG